MAAIIPGRVRGIRQTLPTGTLLGRLSAGAGAPEIIPVSSLIQAIYGRTGGGSSQSISALLDSLGATQGDILYRGAGGWTVLAPGTSGDVLTTGGSAANPSWTAIPAANIQTLLDGISTTQGTILYYNGTSWVALAPGASGDVLTSGGSGANPSWAALSSITLASANMYLNANLAIGGTGWQNVAINTIDYDATSVCNATSGTVTIATAGKYILTCGAYIQNGATAGTLGVGFQYNRGGAVTPVNAATQVPLAANGTDYILGSVLMDLNSGDIITLAVLGPSGITALGGATQTYKTLTHLAIQQLPAVTGSGSSGSGGSAMPPFNGTYTPGRPRLSAFSWFNQGSATATEHGATGPITLAVPAYSGQTLYGLWQAVPGSTPWAVTAMFTSAIPNLDWAGIYLLVSDGTKLETVSCVTGGIVQWQEWNSDTSYSGGANTNEMPLAAFWVRITNDGTNLTFYFSSNGADWIQIEQHAVGSFLGAITKCGFAGYNNIGSGPPLQLNLWNFEAVAGTGTNVSWT